jgi:hypothetical protein
VFPLAGPAGAALFKPNYNVSLNAADVKSWSVMNMMEFCGICGILRNIENF